MPDIVEIYCGGACHGNPGPGGWAFIVRRGTEDWTGTGGEPQTTNQRMELTAAIRALESLKESSLVRLHSNSQYLISGMNQ